jgi:hypothetical protein
VKAGVEVAQGIQRTNLRKHFAQQWFIPVVSVAQLQFLKLAKSIVIVNKLSHLVN